MYALLNRLGALGHFLNLLLRLEELDVAVGSDVVVIFLLDDELSDC